MKTKTMSLTLGEISERQISIHIKEQSCIITVSRMVSDNLEAQSILLTPEEAEEIGSFINKEIFTQSLEG